MCDTSETRSCFLFSIGGRLDGRACRLFIGTNCLRIARECLRYDVSIARERIYLVLDEDIAWIDHGTARERCGVISSVVAVCIVTRSGCTLRGRAPLGSVMVRVGSDLLADI